MEVILENPEIPEISGKTRSLYAHSIFGENSRASNGSEVRTSKRKQIPSKKTEKIGFEEVKRRRRGKKEVSLISLENTSKRSRTEVDSKTLDLKVNGKKKGNGAVSGQDLQNLGSFSKIPHSLDDNAIVVPKRPRGFSGRNKFQNKHDGKEKANDLLKGIDSQVTALNTRGAEFSRSKLNNDNRGPVISLGGKRKVPDEFKEGISIEIVSGSDSKHVDDVSVEVTSSQVTKRAHSSVGMGQIPEDDKHAQDEEKHSFGEKSKSTFEDMHEDDEENLEQNAARMLSSRFDPSCTGFSGRVTLSKSQSNDGSYFSKMFDQSFKSLGEDALDGSETLSDSSGRLLRPRRQRKHRGLFRRLRRHFYEVCSVNMDPFWVVRQRIKVFWPLDQIWYFGIVMDYNPLTQLHHIKYDDRDEEWINLQNERFKLLLLPEEVAHRSVEKNSVRKDCKSVKNVDVNYMDQNLRNNFKDSEPIISWLSRSTHRMKSSPLVARKNRTRVLKKLPETILAENNCEMSSESIQYADKLLMNSVNSDASIAGEILKKPLMGGRSSGDQNIPRVYFRRRLNNRCQRADLLAKKSTHRNIDDSVTLLASVIDSVEVLDGFKDSLQGLNSKDCKLFDKNTNMTSVADIFLLKTPFSRSALYLNISLPPLRILDLAYGAQNCWLYNALLLLKYGNMVTFWPHVKLEMFFVDNFVGLRFMLFEGCLKQAVAILCFILTFFHQSKEYHGQLGDIHLPVTSIRFNILGLHERRRQLEFVFYNFLEVKGSKWQILDYKLKRQCVITKELPLSECTYSNIKAIQSGLPEIHSIPTCKGGVSFEKSSWLSNICGSTYSSWKFGERVGKLPPLVLSFAAAPTFFLSLHLNLLMQNNVASIRLQNQCQMSIHECSQQFENLIGNNRSALVDLDQDSEAMVENMWCSLRYAAPSSEWASCAHSKVEAVGPSVLGVTHWENRSKKTLNSALDVSGVSVGCHGAIKSMKNKNLTGLEKWQCRVGSGTYIGQSSSSTPEFLSFRNNSGSECCSHLNHISIQTSLPIGAGGELFEQPGHTAKGSSISLGSPTIGHGNIRRRNPTAPRSIWHRKRHVSRSKLWPDCFSNGFANGHRRPRTQVYFLPFDGFESKPRSNRQKGYRYKRMNDDNIKVYHGSGSPERDPLSVYCDANILVTAGDRGWRECGARVVLESVDHKDWTLSVKVAGETRYSYKAHQFLQPGTTNRYTHAMMWKGGKDWILEFPDRGQWIVFKDMHEECYNRNIRVASVKNIPIPGVRLIDDNDNNALEVPFVRTQKYFRQVENEVDMAMNLSRVVYDMESDDEEWLIKQRSPDNDRTKALDISDDIFERVMDTFEKISYAQQCENLTIDEVEHLMVEVAPMDIIKAIHEHWQQKRQRKGIPLIRQLQPALWEQYQNQIKEWESLMSKTNNFPVGYKGKTMFAEKPPMFAFCLRPRGLEAHNKGTKQRVQRKFIVLGHHNGAFGDSDGIQFTGRKSSGFASGDEKAFVTDKNFASPDISSLLPSSPKLLPSDVVGPSILSLSSDWSERNLHPKFQRNRPQSIGVNLPVHSPRMASARFTQSMRNGASQWNSGFSQWKSPKISDSHAYLRKNKFQLGAPDFNEFRLRDASGAAQHASNMARLKRERASKLFIKADHLLHKAVVALMIAEAMKASGGDSNGDG